MSNTLDELIEAATVSQYQRLLRTQTGRRILERLGFEPQACSKQTGKVPPRVRDRLRILPLPRNMHPVHHESRRKDRAEALQKSLKGRQDVIYTDAAEYKQGKVYVAVITRENGGPASCCSVRHLGATEAEEVAIALALTQKNVRVIVSDSQSAIRNFDAGRISATAVHILAVGQPPAEQVSLIWTPAHQGLRGNEKAHALARGLTFRDSSAVSTTSPSEEPLQTADELSTYNEILNHYKLGRKTYPRAHKNLSKSEEVMWRKLQTGVFPNPQLLSKWHPSVYSPRCRHCDGRADLVHMVWSCPNFDEPDRCRESWESLLLNEEENAQRQVIGLALTAATSQGIPVDG